MQPTPEFSLRSVVKRFGHRTALRDVTLDIVPGEIVLLLGENGAGKSTLLRLLSTLTRPSAGALLFRGQPLQGDAAQALRRELGVLSYEARLYPDLTARENLRVFGTLHGVPGLAARSEALLERVGLKDVPDVPVRAFSSGMSKRLGVARLLLSEPRVVLLDEPYAALDARSQALMDGLLRDLRESGGTAVVVTHQFPPGIAACTRAVVLHQGTLRYNQPVSNLDAAACAALLQRAAA
jgi:heme ABC exporter ATP-binding subunit CcmA